jgi:hypothetical protein
LVFVNGKRTILNIKREETLLSFVYFKGEKYAIHPAAHISNLLHTSPKPRGGDKEKGGTRGIKPHGEGG